MLEQTTQQSRHMMAKENIGFDDGGCIVDVNSV